MTNLNDQIDAAGLRERIGEEDFLYPANTPNVTVCVLWLLGGKSVTGMHGPDTDPVKSRAMARDACYAQLLEMKATEDAAAAERPRAR